MQPVLAPDLFRSTGNNNYRLEASEFIYIGGVAVVSLKACVIPVDAPTKGLSSVNLSLYGSFLGKRFNIKVAEPPVAASIPKTPLPLSRPLMIKLSEQDLIHDYKITVADKMSTCSTQEALLMCNIHTMKLRQGGEYTLTVERYFAGKRSGKLLEQTVRTLEAASVLTTSIQQNETVFARPTGVDIVFDKEMTKGTLQLYALKDGKRSRVETDTVLSGKNITVSWQGQLARQTSYELEISSATASDGSGLDGVFKLIFQVSGGPKVADINIGPNRVAAGTVATLSFDQPILDTQDITEVITATGGAQVIGKKDHQVMISFKDVPRCGSVMIKVSDSLKSSYDISGGSAWSYVTRMLCQQVGSIGSSVKGRSIVSYSFGNGQRTVVYTGAIHGSELSTRALMIRWIDELEANPQSIPSDKTVIVIPVLNPDGVVSGSRTNANDVDLNRNFATNDWTSDITTTSNAPFPGGGGKSPLSEPEAQSIAAFMSRMRPSLVLSYHSVGNLVAANQTGDSGSRAAMYASLSGYRNTTGLSGTFEYGISGTADDYYAEKLGVASILIELGSHTDPQFARNQKAMWAMLR